MKSITVVIMVSTLFLLTCIKSSSPAITSAQRIVMGKKLKFQLYNSELYLSTVF